MISLIVSILALGVIIMIHESGHFLAAKACGVGVIEFSIGMGPRLLSRVKGATRYSLRLFPFGGSCMMLGEEMEEDEYDDDDGPEGPEDETARENRARARAGEGIYADGRLYPRSAQFVNKPAIQRFVIIAAGPFFNFLLAFLLSVVITGLYGFDRPIVTEVFPGMPVAEAGIEAGDEIYALRTGKTRMTVECARDIGVFMASHSDAMENADEFILYYHDTSEGGARKQAAVTPVYDAEAKTNRLGFSYSYAYGKVDGPGKVLLYSVYNVKYCIRSVIESLRMIVRGRVNRGDVMGPVRMVAVMDETVDAASGAGIGPALITLFDIMILISGSLGCMNLLPLPALDGGRLVFILIELITRRAVPKRFEAGIHAAGMMLLLGLMFFILANDITMLITGK